MSQRIVYYFCSVTFNVKQFEIGKIVDTKINRVHNIIGFIYNGNILNNIKKSDGRHQKQRLSKVKD